MNRATLTAVLASAALVVAACGDDDGGGSAAEFCTLVENSPVFSDTATEEQAAEGLAQLADAAPSEIADDVKELRDAAVAINEIDFDEVTEEELAELNERFAGVEQAQENAEAWVRANCDNIDDSFFQS